MNERAPDATAFLYPFLADECATDDGALLEAVRRSALDKCATVVELRRRFIAEQEAGLIAAASAIADRLRAGGRLFAFGCGGSATDAIDVAHDFVMPTDGVRPLPAVSLVTDPAVLTALGNDVGFDNVFVRQLIAYAREGDVALGISTSGNSRALVDAFRQARRQRLLTIGVLGYDGGEAMASGALDHALIVRADYVPRVQEVQATILHTLRALVAAQP
jgi:D-sedoheptulose 7-phosphate isomerase